MRDFDDRATGAPWSGGHRAVGTLVKIAAPEVVELLAAAGLDFVVIDTEHGSIDARTLSLMIAVARAHGMTVFVRVPGCAPRDVAPPLDAGADGLFVPHVDSPAVARAVVDACRFPPLGNRGGSPYTRAGDWGRLDTRGYLDRGNRGVTVVAQIESSAAAADVAEIGEVAGIDAVFVGPFDLALAGGLVPGGDEVGQLVRATERRAAAAGVPVGGMAAAAGAAVELFRRGVDFVVVGNDASLLTQAARGLVVDIRTERAQAGR